MCHTKEPLPPALVRSSSSHNDNEHYHRGGVIQYEDGKLEIEAGGEKYKFSVPDGYLDTAQEVMHKAGCI